VINLKAPSAIAALALLSSCAAPAKVAETAAPACAIPADITPAPAYTPPAAEIVADEPTAFYMLSLTWAPEDCRETAEDPGFRVQCRANAFGFVLHGLWPNGAAKRHPRYCAPAPAISPATVRKHACMTPSTTMLQHEWAAHGTCGWTDPEAYFAQAARLWNGLNRPDLPGGPTTAGAVRDAFAAANPWIARDGVYIKATEGRLVDVRLCYDLQYRPMACKGSLGPADGAALTVEPRAPR